MNISIISLVSTSLFAYSPLFIGNQISFFKGHFQRVTSSIFFNQKQLYLKQTSFTQIYGIAVHNVNENYRQDIKDEIFTDYKILNISNEFQARSITIVNCQFNSLDSIHSLLVNNKGISIYITDSLFQRCKSTDGVIYLELCRCLTITHTCSYFSYCQFRHCFLYNNCQQKDFSLILYNSIYESNLATSDTQQRAANIFCKYGDQYLKCNNMTQTQFIGFQFDGAQCFSFAMTTVKNAKLSCLYFSGSQSNLVVNKMIEMVNFNNNGADNYELIRFSTDCSFHLIAKNCVLLTNTKIFGQESISDGKPVATVNIYNCVVTKDVVGDNVVESDSTYVNGMDLTHFMWLPHYTRDQLCVGTNTDTHKAARGCNAGFCLPENCDRTIGFPDDVVPYTSVFHGDFQTPTFTSTDYFSKSSYFSESDDFSTSFVFTTSGMFSESTVFPLNKSFTESIAFTNSEKFSSSFYFSLSNEFSKSLNFNEIPRDVPMNLGNGNGKNKGKMIGIIVGVVAAVAIIAAVVTIVLIKSRSQMDSMSGGEVVTQESVVSIDNALQKEMDNDDPFAIDFQDD